MWAVVIVLVGALGHSVAGNSNTIANYDPSIIPFLDASIGSAFEKPMDEDTFVEVTDWQPPVEE